MNLRQLIPSAAALLLLAATTACDTVDDERIPNMPVNINLGNTGTWTIYGVNGFGSHRDFILDNGIRVPEGFPYIQTSATGFGGVLLISGMDPFSTVTDIPLAYDLACPVERNRNIRVQVSDETYVAVCPECHSSYDVTMQRGAPISGPAATGKYKYGLKTYSCYPGSFGGYVITN